MRKLFLTLSAIFFLLISAMSQSRVTGKVTDDKGQGVARASVVVKGTRVGTTTNSDGEFTLNAPAGAKTLVISSVDMVPQEVAITGRNVTVAMVSRASNLDEVVIVGYGGPQKKTNITSSSTTVGAKELENRPFTSVDEMLAGKVPGLIAPSFSGQPGAAQSIRIRGISSIAAGNNPLYVVDGVIINSGDLSRLTTTANSLAGINANDIENVTVLKDAQATALYGSRGAAGVILITTKSGRAGKTKLRLDVEMGSTKYANVPDDARLINADEWLMLYEEGLRNSTLYVSGFATPALLEADIQAKLLSYGKGSGVNTDWKSLITRQGQQQQYNLSASGGEGKTTFFLSGGYFKQDASVIASDFNRYSFTANVKHTSNKLSLGVNLGGSNEIQHTPSNGGAFANPSGSVVFLLPTQNPFAADGSLNISRTGNTNFPSVYNPLYIAKYDQRNLNVAQVRASTNIEYSFIRNLKLAERAGIDVNYLNEYTYQNPFHGDGRTVGGRGSASDSRIFNWISTTSLAYSGYAEKAKNFKVDALVAFETQKSKSLFVDAAATTYPPTTDLPLSTNAATITNGKESASDYDFLSVLSTATVNYKSKYVLSGSFRRDGSSRFSETNRYGNFWSVGMAWNVDQEAFFAPATKIFNSFKIRGSYGTTGNANISNYGWRQTFGYGANYNGLPGGTFNSIGNSVLTWETNKQFDIGTDIGILKNRVNVIFDYYKRVSSNLLFGDPVSPTTGFASVTRNIGTMQNVGWEFSLNTTPIKMKNFNWNLNFNISHNTNKITKLPGGKDIIDGAFILREGLDYRTYFARVFVGVDPTNGDPLWYADSSHKATVNNRSLAIREPLVGQSASPKYTGGLTSTFSYMGISLSGDFIFNYGNYVTDGWAFYLTDGVDGLEGKYASNLRRWQKPGDITDVPKYVNSSTNSSSSFSTRFMQKGDFIRLRNVTLGYNLDSKMLNTLHLHNVISSFNVYVRGTNLWTKTYDKNLTIDPEAGVNGSSNLDIYYTKTITVGLNLGF